MINIVHADSGVTHKPLEFQTYIVPPQKDNPNWTLGFMVETKDGMAFEVQIQTPTEPTIVK